MSWAGAHQINIREHRHGSRYATNRKLSVQPRTQTNSQLQDLVCFSHLRWHFVFQRPQHLMTRFAEDYRVFYVEEPVGTDAAEPWLDAHTTDEAITVLVPRLPDGQHDPAVIRSLLDGFFAEYGVSNPVHWYYTPMSLPVSADLPASLVVYDCMDELSAFHGAPPELVEQERELLKRADLVFTESIGLDEAKRHRHPHVHAFPSSVDVDHFAQARNLDREPDDQAGIPHPRLGFYGVIDERLDIELLDAVAALRPDWQLVMIGPVVKIDPARLPQRPNIHYLGPKLYDELPHYLHGWDVALMPFALNESTRFISPTKTPEYLAAGRPVVSTPITDVVRTYGEPGLVRIAGTPDAFVAAAEAALKDAGHPEGWLGPVDEALADMSWDKTWARMKELMECSV
jgi:UDP-galactopyranose mutase